jgi:hypothetical protein
MNRPKIPNVVGRTQEIKSQRLASTVTIGLVISGHLLLLLLRQLQGAAYKAAYEMRSRLESKSRQAQLRLIFPHPLLGVFGEGENSRASPRIRRQVSVSVMGWV